ncbi:glutamate receptor ionotropic, kainate 5-like [Schistocerca piceifrons]|uniref:glutamate receptor ionotropic, kainate 5-like n=1 Tax=Schistocerca piceifrons TaxID=274613 RepID=UPI001F5FE9E8|nr:glutamate receptor ionotropic, kainate 5-like [Schistocerca piceifrons]
MGKACVWSILILSVPAACQLLSVPSYANLVAALHKHFASRCTYIIHDEHYNEGNIRSSMSSTKFRKELSHLFIPAGSIKFEGSVVSRLSCNEQNPFFIVMLHSKKIHLSLQTLAQSTISKSKWLMIAEEGFDINNILAGAFIPFNTEFVLALRKGEIYNVSEIYQVSPELSLTTVALGEWDPKRNRSWNIPSMYRRRTDLQGVTLNVTTLEYSPMLKLNENGIGGFFGIVWTHLEKTLNFKSRFKRPPDNAWGTMDENGTWDGMIALLLSGEADVGVNAFTLTKSRLTAVDFSSPVIYTSICIFIALQKTREFAWTDYVRPFSSWLWLAVCVCMMGLSLCMPLLHHAGRLAGTYAYEPQCHNPVISIFYVFGIFCQQGHDLTPESLPCRVLYFTAYITAVIILASYSAGLIAFLTVIKVSIPFTDFKSLLDLGTYRLGMAHKSGVLNVFNDATVPLLKNIYRRLILPGINSLPKNQDDVVKRLCSSKYAYMRSRILGVRDDSGNCHIVPIPQASLPETLGLVFPKNSSYRGLINVVLQKYKEIGILRRTETEIWPKVVHFEDNSYTTVGFDKVIPVFVVLSAGMALSIIIFCLEYARVFPIAKLQELCYGEEYAGGVYEHQDEGLFASTVIRSAQSSSGSQEIRPIAHAVREGSVPEDGSARMVDGTDKYLAVDLQGSMNVRHTSPPRS